MTPITWRGRKQGRCVMCLVLFRLLSIDKMDSILSLIIMLLTQCANALPSKIRPKYPLRSIKFSQQRCYNCSGDREPRFFQIERMRCLYRGWEDLVHQTYSFGKLSREVRCAVMTMN
jgi:hypothetical protein